MMMRGMPRLLRKRTVIAAALSLVIFSSSISVLMGIAEAPRSFLGSSDVYVILGGNTESVINSRVELSLADRLLSLDIADETSPEIFAFAEIHGWAVVIRGVNFTRFTAIEDDAHLIEGLSPSEQDMDGALIGSRLAGRLDVKVGDRLPLVGSFDPSIAEVEILGILESDSGIGDELMVSLPVAQTLSGMPLDYCSILRITGDIEFLETIFAPGTARFSIYDLYFPQKEIAVNSTMEVSFWLKNWGDAEGVANVRLMDMTRSMTLLEEALTLPAGGRIQMAANFSADADGDYEITAFLDDLLPQLLIGNVTVRGSFLILAAPEKTAEYHNFTVQVTDEHFQPKENSVVTVDGDSYLTNLSGECLIDAHLSPGQYNITANFPGYAEGNVTVEVLDSLSLSPNAVIEVYDLQLSPGIVKARENSTVALFVHNRGNASGMTTIYLYRDGVLFANEIVSLDPLEATILYYNVSFTTSGERVFSTDSLSKTLIIESNYELNSDMIELLLRYGGQGSINPSRGALLYNTAKISEGNIIIVLVSLAFLSATLVTLGVSISFMKEINDNLRIIGILRSIGASSRQLMGIIFRESLILSLPAACIGIAGGMALAMLIDSSGRLIAFGHVIEPVLDPTFMLAAVVGSVAICIGSSLLTGLSVSRKVAIKMIRGLREDVSGYSTLEELLRDEG